MKESIHEIKTKGFRHKIPPYRVCITWLINNNCNYRCSYCLNGFEEPPGFRILSPEEWSSVWENIYNNYGTVSMQITGGEPAVYPNFFKIMKEISRMHYIDLQTNLFWDPQEIIGYISLEHISRIGGSYHPQYTEFEPFLEKLVKLRDAGFWVEVNYVAYPPILDEAKEYLNMAEEKKIKFTTLSFQGEYQGRRYPESYSDDEKAILKKLNLASGESAESMLDWDIQKKKIGNSEEAEEPLRICRMGQMYTWIKPNGEAMRCCKSSLVLGNIIDGTFSLLDEAIPCNLKNCICWRNMTIGEENRWLTRWPGVK